MLAALLTFAAGKLVGNQYVFFAGYVVLQFVVLATAWNILGGYCGYVNFGSAAFFAIGTYTTIAFSKLPAFATARLPSEIATHINTFFPPSLPMTIAAAGLFAGAAGLAMGYLTLRLRGTFFSIATLALSVVLMTVITNWDFVGGSRGAYVIRPREVKWLGISYIEYLFLTMAALAVISITIARSIERSRLGFGFAAIRDDEGAAEAAGVPTLQLKLVATTLSGALMGMAGAPFPYYVGYVEPTSVFSLSYAINAIAMPMIGGTTSWVGPLLGAILLGTLQQVATVTISSAVSLLIVGLLLMVCVIIAPNGIVGLLQAWSRQKQSSEPKRSNPVPQIKVGAQVS
jgi:branched-chain amino acid transport system permease protein